MVFGSSICQCLQSLTAFEDVLWCIAEQAKVDEDEALARQLQEQEEALARGGRATRASLRGPSKGTAKPPAPSARQAAVKQAAATRGAAGLRSSSRLKPSAAPAANVRTTRAAAAGSLCGVLSCVLFCNAGCPY